LESRVLLRDEEGWSTQATPLAVTGVNLVVQQLLDVVNGQQVFTVHGNNNGVPNLGYQNLLGV